MIFRILCIFIEKLKMANFDAEYNVNLDDHDDDIVLMEVISDKEDDNYLDKEDDNDLDMEDDNDLQSIIDEESTKSNESENDINTANETSNPEDEVENINYQINKYKKLHDLLQCNEKQISNHRKITGITGSSNSLQSSIIYSKYLEKYFAHEKCRVLN